MFSKSEVILFIIIIIIFHKSYLEGETYLLGSQLPEDEVYLGEENSKVRKIKLGWGRKSYSSDQ